MVNILKFPIQECPKPYPLNWLSDRDPIRVKKQALVAFSIGNYKDELPMDELQSGAARKTVAVVKECQSRGKAEHLLCTKGW